MDSEIRFKVEQGDLTEDEAEELQDFVDETGLEVEDAYEVWRMT